MKAFTYFFSPDLHEKEISKRDAEIQKLRELLKKKKEIEKRDQEIKRLKTLLTSNPEVSESESDEEESDESSDEEYECESSDEEYECESSDEECEGDCRMQHCSHCGGAGHKITTCYERSDILLKNLRLNPEAVRDSIIESPL